MIPLAPGRVLACLCLCGLACAPARSDVEAPVRSQRDLVVLAGPLSLDASFDDRIRADRPARAEARRVLGELHGTLEGTDLHFGRRITFASLGTGFSGAPCEAECPGRPELALGVGQAGIDVAGLAAERIARQDVRIETARLLRAQGLCVTDGEAPCVHELSESRVAFAEISMEGDPEEATRRARDLTTTARLTADVVLLSVVLPPGPSEGDDHPAVRNLLREAAPDVLFAVRPEGRPRVELVEGQLVLHAPVPLASRRAPRGGRRDAVVWWLHLANGRVDWIEGIPVRVLAARTRPALLDEAVPALAALVERSEGSGLREEHGRAILDLP